MAVKRRKHTSHKKRRMLNKRVQKVKDKAKSFKLTAKSKAYGSNFLTYVEQEVMEQMLSTNSVKATCEHMGFSASRYYEVTRNIVKKWKMSMETNNYLLGKFKTAKTQKNLLVRHLTEVRRVELIGPTVSTPQQVETTETIEPMVEQTQ